MLSPAHEAILSNPKLPSLPAVALEVLELTAREDAEIGDFEKAIERDQAIAVRILRTVNSSYYGLSSRCGSIRQAVSLLGVQTVRGLVLGFSLERALDGGDDDEISFDFTGYWRRSFQAASAARVLADMTGQAEPEEAFIAALVQDAGMIATWRIHGDRYLQIIDMTRGRHDELASLERRILDVDHATIGSEMSRRWHFPESIVDAIASHHACIEEPCRDDPLVKVVRLAGIAAEAMSCGDAINEFERKAFEWFKIDEKEARTLLGTIADDACKLASALSIQVGDMPTSAQILARAAEMLAALPEAMQPIPDETTVKIDATTGLPDREELLADLEASFRGARDMTGSLGGVALALLLVGIDDVRMFNERFGDTGGDAALAHVARCARDVLTHLPGAVGVYRFVGAEIAVILRGFDGPAAIAVAEELRATIARRPLRITSRSGESEFCTTRVTIGVGVHHPNGTSSSTASPDALLRASMCAVTSGRRKGRDRVTLHDEEHAMSASTGRAA